ncbi:MAG TPA: hypothetical protein VFV38_40090 [Ktedonobacteraceae bacterium]|nr:hypothetical protein [Ktedonobacteraceae bacterium]
MALDTNMLIEAGQLIQWALQPRAHPATKPEYQHLLDRYRDLEHFRTCVEALCQGLGLEISAVGPMGIVLTARDDSVFAMTSSDYRRSGSADDRLIDGLILVGIIATMYPQAQDLEGDLQTVHRPIAIEDVEKNLRALCERMEIATRHQPDPTVQEILAGLDPAWRAYQARAATKTTSDGRASTTTTIQMIARAFDVLEKQACVTPLTRNGQKVFRPTWKYQVMVQQASVARLAQLVRKLLATEGKNDA